jgi:hypothetical protein
MRSLVVRDGLFRALFLRGDLERWMLACSGADEQYYLNSCEAAAGNQAIVRSSSCPVSAFVSDTGAQIHRAGTVAELLVLMRLTCAHMRNVRLPTLPRDEPAFVCLWPGTAPSVYEFAANVLRRVDTMTENLSSDGTAACRLSFPQRSDE